MSNIDPNTIGDTVGDSGDAEPTAPPVPGLLGYRIAVGRFTESVLRKSITESEYYVMSFCAIHIIQYM